MSDPIPLTTPTSGLLTTTQNTRDSTATIRARLEDLPAELYIMIFDFTFTPLQSATIRVLPSSTLPQSDSNNIPTSTSSSPNPIYNPSIPLHLSHVSRSTRQQHLPALFAQTTFIIDTIYLCDDWMSRMPHSIQSQMREIRCLKEDVGEEELQKQKDEMMLGFSFATMAQLKRAEAWRNVKDRSMGAMFGRLNLVTDWEEPIEGSSASG